MSLLLHDYLNTKDLEIGIEEGLISRQFHPTFPLAILNYTNAAQYKGAWTYTTKRCRGLIYNTQTMEIVARPFPKFFNHDDTENAPAWMGWPSRHVVAMEKADGSLGIVYFWAGEPYIATRGSFTSEQAVEANKILQENRKLYTSIMHFEKYTYLFEIIYPENRIVVNYGDTRELRLLDVLVTRSGHSVLHDSISKSDLTYSNYREITRTNYPVVKVFDLDELMNSDFAVDDEEEGYVLLNKVTSERVKIKGSEYKRLHRLITGVSTKTIWEHLSEGRPLDELLEAVPDEFYDWVRKTAADLQKQYDEIRLQSLDEYVLALRSLDKHFYQEERDRRKTFALEVKDSAFKDIHFCRYDNGWVAPLIWKRLAPKFSKPFWNQSEATA